MNSSRVDTNDDKDATEEEIQATVDNVMLQLADLESCVRNKAGFTRDANGNNDRINNSNISQTEDLFSKEENAKQTIGLNKTKGCKEEDFVKVKVEANKKGCIARRNDQSALLTVPDKGPDGITK